MMHKFYGRIRTTLNNAQSMRWDRLLYLALVSTALFGFSKATYAHLFSAHKWTSSTGNWYILTSNVPTFFFGEYRTAAATWTNAPGSFALYESDPRFSKAAIGAKFFTQDSSLPDDWYGATFLYWDSAGYISSATTYLNRDYIWYTDGVRTPDVRMASLHEMGHWVHFVDSCSPADTIMCNQDLLRRSLTTHDTDELRAVYP